MLRVEQLELQSSPELFHHRVVVAVAGGGVVRRRLVEVGQVVWCHLDVAGAGVLLQAAAALRAWDRHEVVFLRE